LMQTTAFRQSDPAFLLGFRSKRAPLPDWQRLLVSPTV
jgi:hypothetical protein